MESSKAYAFFFICMLFISTATPILGCGTCGKPPPKTHKPRYKTPKAPITLPPIIGKPPVIVPPITLPPLVKPPITLPPIVKPPVTVPPVTVPPVTVPPVTVPPVTVPPVTLPPIITKPPSGKPCPPPEGKETCPIDTLKLGSCVDLLGGMVHIGFGDPAVNECCPVLQGLVEMEAAACLCTTLKINALNLSVYVPLALQLLITCGKTPPPGYTCFL